MQIYTTSTLPCISTTASIPSVTISTPSPSPVYYYFHHPCLYLYTSPTTLITTPIPSLFIFITTSNVSPVYLLLLRTLLLCI